MTNQALRAARRTLPDPCQVRNCAYLSIFQNFWAVELPARITNS